MSSKPAWVQNETCIKHKKERKKEERRKRGRKGGRKKEERKEGRGKGHRKFVILISQNLNS